MYASYSLTAINTTRSKNAAPCCYWLLIPTDAHTPAASVFNSLYGVKHMLKNIPDDRLVLYGLVSLCIVPIAVVGLMYLDELLNADWQTYAPDSSTGYTLLFIIFLCGVFFLLWKNHSNDSQELPAPVVTLTGLAGFTIAACSFGLSVSYGLSMDIGAIKWYAFLFGAVSSLEFLASYFISYYLYNRNALMFGFSVAVITAGIVISIMAGQALIAGKLDEVKAERVQQSDSYQVAMQQRQNAHERMEKLAISDNAYHSAQLEIETALNNAKSLMADNIHYSWSDCSNFPHSLCSVIGNYKGRTKDLNAQLAPLQQAIQRNQKIVQQYEKYQAAKQLANELKAQPLPTAANSGDLPHIKWLAISTGIEADLLEARLYIGLAICFELMGLWALYVYGKNNRPNNLRIADVTLNQPIPQMAVGGTINSDGLIYAHSGERVLTAEEAKAWTKFQAWKKTNNPPARTYSSTHAQGGKLETPSHSQNQPASANQPANNQPASANQPANNQQVIYKDYERVASHLSQVKGKGRTGKIDSCVNCGSDYIVKVAHQLRCKTCSDEVKNNFAKSHC
jgi:hypothetical protein